MEIIEAIFGRHSVGKVKPDAVKRELVEKLLSAAVQAPNHHKLRPWRFVVLMENGRSQLGDVFAASLAERKPDSPPEALDKVRALPLRAPVVIAVGVDKPSDGKTPEIENIAAVAAACQNLSLAAHAEGLGLQWRTGDWAMDLKVKEFLGFAPDQHNLGFLYIGYPEAVGEYPARPGFEDRVRWVE